PRLTLGICQQPVVPNLHEPFGQNVLYEATQELVGGKRHRLLPPVVGVVLVTEAHPAIAQLDEASVADGDAVRGAGQVLEHLRGTAERRPCILPIINATTLSSTTPTTRCTGNALPFWRSRTTTAWSTIGS